MSLKIYTKPLLNTIIFNLKNFLKGILISILLIFYYKYFHCNNLTMCGNEQTYSAASKILSEKNLLHTVDLVLKKEGINPIKTKLMFYKLDNNFFTKIQLDNNVWHSLTNEQKVMAAYNTNKAYNHLIATIFVEDIDAVLNWYKNCFQPSEIDDKLFNQLENEFILSFFFTKSNITNLILNEYDRLCINNNFFAETLFNNTKGAQYIGGISQIINHKEFLYLIQNHADEKNITTMLKHYENEKEGINLKSWIEKTNANDVIFNYLSDTIMDLRQLSLKNLFKEPFNYDCISSTIIPNETYNTREFLKNSYAVNKLEISTNPTNFITEITSKIPEIIKETSINEIKNLNEQERRELINMSLENTTNNLDLEIKKKKLVDLNGNELTVSKKIIPGKNTSIIHK